jgi:hypothetical protein
MSDEAVRRDEERFIVLVVTATAAFNTGVFVFSSTGDPLRTIAFAGILGAVTFALITWGPRSL